MAGAGRLLTYGIDKLIRERDRYGLTVQRAESAEDKEQRDDEVDDPVEDIEKLPGEDYPEQQPGHYRDDACEHHYKAGSFYEGILLDEENDHCEAEHQRTEPADKAAQKAEQRTAEKDNGSKHVCIEIFENG